VSLGGDIAANLPELRAQAATRFSETFTVYTGADALDEETGLYAPSEAVLYANVRGRVKYPTATVSERAQGAQVSAIQDVQIHVGVGATPDVTVDSYWRGTASSMDASLVGRVYRTKGYAQSGTVTAHRYPVEQVS